MLLLLLLFRSWATTSHEVKLRTKMTDFTYGTCFSLKCKAFGASHRPELLGWQKPTKGQDHSDFRWYSDLFRLHGVNLTVETNKRAREMYFDKPLYGHFYILLLPLGCKSSDQQVKGRKHPRATLLLNVDIIFVNAVITSP